MSFSSHPSVKMVPKVKKHCLPLFERFGLTGFCYDMSFQGGELSVLTDSIANFESLYARDYSPICSDAIGRTVATGVYTLNLLSKNSVDGDFYTKKFESLYETNQIIHMIHHGEHFDEMITFSFSMHSGAFEHFILNDLTKLKGFIRYFKESMKNEIAVMQKKENRLHFPDLLAGESRQATLNRHEHPQNIRLILEDGREAILSPQQAACLKLLMQGKAMKQIAAELFLSIRTVEHYLSAVRAKLSCRSLLTLIGKYGDQL